MPNMKKPRVFVSLCGTSLFVNQLDDALKQLLRDTSNANAADLSEDQTLVHLVQA